MNCPKCQTPVSAEWVACPKCGTQLNQPPIGVGIPLTEVKRPSRMQYFAGIVIIVITTVIAMALLISSARSLLNPAIRVVVPGTQQVTLNKTGYYILFCEDQSVLNGTTYSDGSISDMTITLSQNDSTPVELSDAPGTLTYKTDDRSGYAVFDFWLDEPGTYTLDAEYDAGKSGPDTVIALGCFDITGTFLISFIIGTLGFIVGIIIIIRAAVKRRSIGRRAGMTAVDRFWC